ncbi:hypothetical protein AC578_2495 [Pseudocercospora eumusae]|uniref:Uncharacterized protein n=1 Tax=Pseudocercospora eumusae TaxID=321146 RepID=A0A139HXJ1_9PEZI|nr:hypothetical protein AC578_2495 [Pseudocercospora eumusae]
MSSSVPSTPSARQNHPVNSVLELCRLVAIKIGLDVGLFEHLSKQDDKSVEVEDLASATGVEPRLLRRILRVLANTNNVIESSPGYFRANDACRHWTDPNVRATGEFHFEHTFQVILTLPTYLKENGYREPTDPTRTPWNISKNTSLPFFDWLDSPGNETSRSNFDKSMTVGTMSHFWFEKTVSASQVLGSVDDPEAPLYVDIGGGLGEHACKLHAAHPDLVGKLIVQDLPQSIHKSKQRKLPEKISLMEYNFFTPQPIQGAKNYYLRRVLHDWPDKEAIRILQNQRMALRRDYSRILLNEKVVPDQGASPADVVSDIIGMVVGGTERTETEWRQLVAQAGGLVVTDMMSFEECAEKIIVIELE